MLASAILPSWVFIWARAASSATALRFISAARSFSFICAAAFLVNVTASMPSKSPPPCMYSERRSIITYVLPLPAEAETITLPPRSMAAVCCGVRFTITRPPFRRALCARYLRRLCRSLSWERACRRYKSRTFRPSCSRRTRPRTAAAECCRRTSP